MVGSKISLHRKELFQSYCTQNYVLLPQMTSIVHLYQLCSGLWVVLDQELTMGVHVNLLCTGLALINCAFHIILILSK